MDINKKQVKKKDSKISKQQHIIEEISTSGETLYNCTACCKIFRSRSQKYYHLNCNQLHDVMYKCEDCDKVFARHSQWKYHRESHISPINECQKCQKTFSNPLALKKHASLHKTEPKLCPHCDKTFQKKISLDQHIAAQHLKQLQYGCAYCSKKYSSKSTLQLHLQTHEKKRFECSFCGKLFQRNSILNLHLKRHYNTNSFKCTVCHKIFSESGALARHRKIHEENVLQYHCKLCNKSILRKDNMTRHINTIHPEEKFDNIVEIIRPINPTNISEQKDVESKKLNNNFIIIENKLIQKSSTDIKSETLNVAAPNTSITDLPTTLNNISNYTEYPLKNRIKVITSVPVLKNEIFSTDIGNTSQDLVDSKVLENQDSNKDSLPQVCNQIQDNSGKTSFIISQSHLKTHQNQTEQQFKVTESCNNQEIQDYFVENIIEKSINISNINSNELQFKYQLSREPTSNTLENRYRTINQDEIQVEPKTQTISTVIRSVGNVKKNLTSSIFTLTKPINTQNLEYKHKKYCRNNYNIDLYRKILGCDDEDGEDEDQQQNSINLETDHSYDTISNSMMKSSTTVHWRKSFKNNYETSAS